MSNTTFANISFSPSREVAACAHKWAENDREFLNHASRFGSPLVRRIAIFFLQVVEKGEVQVCEDKIQKGGGVNMEE